MLSWNWETDMKQCLQMKVFWPQCLPLCPCLLPCAYMKTLPIYLNCVRCCVAKMFLNQRIHSVRVSVYLSILSVHPSLLLHAFYFFKPNVLESICEGAEGTPCPAKAQVEYASVPLIHVLYINKIILKTKKEGGDNPSKEDLAVINVACSLFSKS